MQSNDKENKTKQLYRIANNIYLHKRKKSYNFIGYK